MRVRKNGRFFGLVCLTALEKMMIEDFDAACRKIENDGSYLPNISSRQLLSLVMDEQGGAKHAPRRSAFAIQNSTITPVTENGDSLGKVYQLLVAQKSCLDDSDYPVWNVDNTVVIFVHKSGEYSLHARENAEKKDFSAPLTHLNINRYLNNQNSLSLQESQKQKKICEIKTNSQILAQAYRTGTGFFGVTTPGTTQQVPAEYLTKIASLLGDNPDGIEDDEEAYKIARDSFGRPQ